MPLVSSVGRALRLGSSALSLPCSILVVDADETTSSRHAKSRQGHRDHDDSPQFGMEFYFAAGVSGSWTSSGGWCDVCGECDCEGSVLRGCDRALGAGG